MKLSLCNEVIRELSFERQCALAAGLGYRGLELAPFTFGDDAWRMPAAKRAEIRTACADAGLEVSGLHWLLAAPAGLSITTSRSRGLAEERRRPARLGRSLRRAGRRLSGARLAGAAARRHGRTTPRAPRRRGDRWPPSRRATARSSIASSRWPGPDCNFVNTLAEAAEIVRRIGNPALRIMVDTLAAGLMETEPVADAIRRWMPTGLMAHIQFNDRNRRGPGRATTSSRRSCGRLRETGYGGWIAMEPFVYEPDGPTCARAHDRLCRGPAGVRRMKVKLEEVERYERHVKMRLAVPLRRDHRHRRHAGGDPRARIALADGRTSHGVAAEALAAKWFEKSPAIHRRAEPRPAAPVARPRHRALSARRASSTPFDLFAGTYRRAAASAARRSGSIRWWRPTARRCSTAPSSMRWAARPASRSPT